MPQNLPDRPDFFARHRALLEEAVAATASRDHWTPFPESPSKSVYGEDAAKDGEAAFRDHIEGHFELPGHPGSGALPATETSPYGFPLGVTYPRVASERRWPPRRPPPRPGATPGRTPAPVWPRRS